jgi:Putative prokaryotic signal transducing protein
MMDMKRGRPSDQGVKAVGDMVSVTVAVVTSRTEAELIVGMLLNNGVRAAVSADDAGGQEPQLQVQGVRVLVAPSDAAAARRLLADAEATGDTSGP